MPVETLKTLDPEGDFGRKHLLNPAIFAMLGDLTGARVLDAGCGQGYFSRLMAERGADVVGVEPAEPMVEYAIQKEQERRQGVRYYRQDLSRLEVDVGLFDAVVANMVFLAIADWRPAMANCVGALRPGGLFVFSLEHPCWVKDGVESWQAKECLELREYLHEYETREGLGPNFHRPVSTYINAVISLGCDIREIAEPGLDPQVAAAASGGAVAALVHIPNFIVICAVKRTESSDLDYP